MKNVDATTKDIVVEHTDVDFSVDNKQYMLNTTSRLSKKQILAFYSDPDYCFVVDTQYLNVMREALDPLLKNGGIYYTTHEQQSNKDRTIIVVYVDDILLDVMAELLKVKCRVSAHKCLLEFQCFGADLFEQFDN